MTSWTSLETLHIFVLLHDKTRLGIFYFLGIVKNIWADCFALCMLSNFFKYFFLSNLKKNDCFHPFFCRYIIWMSNNLDLRWSPTFCIGYQRSSKFTASGLRVNLPLTNCSISCKQLGSGWDMELVGVSSRSKLFDT